MMSKCVCHTGPTTATKDSALASVPFPSKAQQRRFRRECVIVKLRYGRLRTAREYL
jgi:hypothetical protein